MISDEVVSKITLNKVTDNYFTVNYNDRIFSVGEILFKALELIKKNPNIRVVQYELNSLYSINISEEYLTQQINDFIGKIESKEKHSTTLSNYIYFKIKIFGKKSIEIGTSFLSFLFNKYVLLLLIPLSLYLSIKLGGLIYYDGIWELSSSLWDSILGILFIYVGIAVLGLFHEFGHASSAAYYKQPSDAIGFGFYIIFPVFYSNVTKIWNLTKWKRIVVNLGGVYFQLLINILLFLLYITTQSIDLKIIIKFFFVSNSLLFIYAVNPFLRNDGYWVYSDLFEIPNLTENSLKFPVVLWRKLKDKTLTSKDRIKFIFQNKALLVYSFLFYIIMTILFSLLFWLTYKNASGIKDVITNFNTKDWTSMGAYKEILKLLFGLFINLFFFHRIFKRVILHQLKRHISA